MICCGNTLWGVVDPQFCTLLSVFSVRISPIILTVVRWLKKMLHSHTQSIIRMFFFQFCLSPKTFLFQFLSENICGIIFVKHDFPKQIIWEAVYL